MLGVRCDVDIFKLTVSAQSIYSEVYEYNYAENRNESQEWIKIYFSVQALND